MRITLPEIAEQIIRECEDPKSTRRTVAESYALAIAFGNDLPWGVINTAISMRWSAAGLTWIKREAWKRLREVSAPRG